MRRILIVEDYRKLLGSLCRGLQSLGYDVLVAETGEQGYQLAMSEPIDALVLDVMLPDGSGFEVLSELRNNGFGKPVVILTARDSAADRARGQQCGADSYLVKPFAFSDLAERLDQLLERAPPNG